MKPVYLVGFVLVGLNTIVFVLVALVMLNFFFFSKHSSEF